MSAKGVRAGPSNVRVSKIEGTALSITWDAVPHDVKETSSTWFSFRTFTPASLDCKLTKAGKKSVKHITKREIPSNYVFENFARLVGLNRATSYTVKLTPVAFSEVGEEMFASMPVMIDAQTSNDDSVVAPTGLAALTALETCVDTHGSATDSTTIAPPTGNVGRDNTQQQMIPDRDLFVSPPLVRSASVVSSRDDVTSSVKITSSPLETTSHAEEATLGDLAKIQQPELETLRKQLLAANAEIAAFQETVKGLSAENSQLAVKLAEPSPLASTTDDDSITIPRAQFETLQQEAEQPKLQARDNQLKSDMLLRDMKSAHEQEMQKMAATVAALRSEISLLREAQTKQTQDADNRIRDLVAEKTALQDALAQHEAKYAQLLDNSRIDSLQEAQKAELHKQQLQNVQETLSQTLASMAEMERKHARTVDVLLRSIAATHDKLASMMPDSSAVVETSALLSSSHKQLASTNTIELPTAAYHQQQQHHPTTTATAAVTTRSAGDVHSSQHQTHSSAASHFVDAQHSDAPSPFKQQLVYSDAPSPFKQQLLYSDAPSPFKLRVQQLLQRGLDSSRLPVALGLMQSHLALDDDAIIAASAKYDDVTLAISSLLDAASRA